MVSSQGTPVEALQSRHSSREVSDDLKLRHSSQGTLVEGVTILMIMIRIFMIMIAREAGLCQLPVFPTPSNPRYPSHIKN